MLNKEEVFEIIENDLLPVIKEYNETKKLNITFEQRQLIKKIWEENIMLGNRADVNCFSCIIHHLGIIESWYEREKPKEVKEAIEEVKPIVYPIPALPKNKGGRPRKNQ